MMIQQCSLQGFVSSFRSFFSLSFFSQTVSPGMGSIPGRAHFFSYHSFFFFPSYSYCSILLFSSPFCPPLICSYPFPLCFFFFSFIPSIFFLIILCLLLFFPFFCSFFSLFCCFSFFSFLHLFYSPASFILFSTSLFLVVFFLLALQSFFFLFLLISSLCQMGCCKLKKISGRAR